MQVSIHEAKTHLSRLLRSVAEGEEVVIARGAEPVAKLVPFSGRNKPREPGAWKGRVRITDEFDAPLPEELLRELS